MRFSDISGAIIEGNADLAEKHTLQALAEGYSGNAIYREALVSGMDVVGKRMQSGEFFIPEVLLAAQVMKRCLEIIKPTLIQPPSTGQTGRIVMGTVQGDLHDIGKNIVIVMLEGAGFEVTDLGVDVSTKRFVEVVRELRPDVLGLSALLSITMLNMKDVIAALRSAGLNEKLAVMVGGASVSKRFADQIGADGYAADAAGAVDLTKSLVKLKRVQRG